ncbi:MAG: nucleotidyl transferase AbiEii/AbiGii toxin family protein [Thermoanaerobaculales bacterium]|nr:nucleotidyl transferase AbiEii/AbiGii toxin family protein [Thermoanaerobaculales bacterium]
MNRAIAGMLERYERRSSDDDVNALREIFQEITLCGLWRAKFFEQAAFYGGTALRVLFGLDRFSEDMDFSLLAPNNRFDLAPYCIFVENELNSWGFSVKVETKKKTKRSAVESAFLKANTREQLLSIDATEEMVAAFHGRRQLKIKIEVDTDPPPGFSTETKFMLQPIPFSVKVYDQPSLFAGKMHAVLCRSWRTRVKGRDWYDLVWYVARGTQLDLAHLEARMRQSGHYNDDASLDEKTFRLRLAKKIEELDIGGARSDVERFLTDSSAVSVWSREFFSAVADRILTRNSHQ